MILWAALMTLSSAFVSAAVQLAQRTHILYINTLLVLKRDKQFLFQLGLPEDLLF